MSLRFKKHYTAAEARRLLPQVRTWLERLGELRSELADSDAAVRALAEQGIDAGGAVVDRWVRQMTAVRELLWEFQSRDIQIKDLDRGLVDFPAIRDGREVFLCWEKDEPDIAFWHDLEAGYQGREPLGDGD
ncbi:MAG: DUF2203 domain-containing protein [Verrucomicrobiota bacterium]